MAAKNPEGFYIDENISRAVARGLQQRGHTVVRAVEVDMEGKDDDLDHLPYATQHNLILVTLDYPFATRTMQRQDFLALVCFLKRVRQDTGRMIELLDEFMQLFDPEQDTGKVFWLG